MDEDTMMRTFGLKRIHHADTQEGALRYMTLEDILTNLNRTNVFKIVFQNQFASFDGTSVPDETVEAISRVFAVQPNLLTIMDPTLHPEGEDFIVAPTSTSECRLSIFWAPRSKNERVHDMTDFYSQPRGRLQRFVETEAKASPWSEAIQGGVPELKRLLRSNAGQMLMTKIRTFNNELVATVGDQVGLGSVQFYTRLLVNLMQSADRKRKRRLRPAKSVAKAPSNTDAVNESFRQRLNSSAKGQQNKKTSFNRSDSDSSPSRRKKSKKKKRRKSNDSSCSEEGTSADESSPERKQEKKKKKSKSRKKRLSLDNGGLQPTDLVQVHKEKNQNASQSGSSSTDATGSFSIKLRRSLSGSLSASQFLNVRHKEGDIAYLATEYIIQGNFPDDVNAYANEVKKALKKMPYLFFTHKVVIGKQGKDESDKKIGQYADALGLGWVVTQEMEEIQYVSEAKVTEFQGDMLHNLKHTDSAGGSSYLKFYKKKKAALYAVGDSSCVVKMHKKSELTKFVSKYQGKLKIWFSALATQSEYIRWAKSSNSSTTK